MLHMAKEVEIIRDSEIMRSWSRSLRSKGKTLALVPTMGYLHQGHLSLIKEAQNHAQVTIVSIYINPGQFSPSEDLSTYPSDFQGDIDKLKEYGVDAAFCPQNLYDYGSDDKVPSGSFEDVGFGDKNEGKVVSCVEEKGFGHETWVRVEKLEMGLCGKSRPVFFRGVATIVTKLFNIVEPDVAVFGKKDYQQWRIIRRMALPFIFQQWSIIYQMVRDLNFAINVIGSDIVRDSDGLAMSSRNVHLLPEEREKALSINKSLFKAKSDAQNGKTSSRELKISAINDILEAGGRIDYAEILNQESLETVEEIESPVVFCIAAWFGKVRLIDNMEINL